MNNNESLDPRTLCRCCGWSFGEDFPWGEDGMSSQFIICDCCACESGNEDYSRESLEEYRRNWLDSGAKWWDAKTKPVDWESGILLREQLDRLKPKRRFHRNPDFSLFGFDGYKTPEEAIAAGKSIDAR